MWKEGITKKHKKTFWVEGYAEFFICGDGFTGVYMCQNLSNTLNMCSIVCELYFNKAVKYFFFQFYWDIIDVQHYISLRYTA